MREDLTRRRMLRAVSAGALGTAAVLAGSANAQYAPAAAGKQSQAQAQYQGKPKDGQMCASCAYFVAPSSCQKVEGAVQASGWCKNFLQKKQ
jgi:hypothetical protein